MTGMPGSLLTRLARQAAGHARAGALTLQVCAVCKHVQYPYREVCHRCLAGELSWQPVDDRGSVVAIAEICASHEPWFREHAPWRIGSVLLAVGPTVIAHLDSPRIRADQAVRVRQVFAGPEQCVLMAYEEESLA